MVKVKAPFRSTSVFHDAYTMDPLTGVKSTYPIYFLRIAGDPAAQCMMDTAQRVDGPNCVSELA